MKIKYKIYDEITGLKILDTSYIYKGMLTKVKAVIQQRNLFCVVLAYFGIIKKYDTLYFWCPWRDILSVPNYANTGKKMRGKYSNLWFELTQANVTQLENNVLNTTGNFNFDIWIKITNLEKVTNKELKEYLDESLLPITL